MEFNLQQAVPARAKRLRVWHGHATSHVWAVQVKYSHLKPGQVSDIQR